MKKVFMGLLAFVLVISYSCKQKKADSDLRNKYIAKIKDIDSAFKDALKTNKDAYALGRELADSCLSFTARFPKDTVAPKLLYRAGVLYMTDLKDYKESIKCLQYLYEKYPTHRLAPEGLYWIANTYNFFMKNSEKAKEYYEKIIKEYPNHRFAAESKILVENLGKSDEDLFNATQKGKEQANKQGNQ